MGIFADYCSTSLLRNTVRSFASVAGDVSLDDFWGLGSVKIVILWVFYIIMSVIILLNVLIAVVTKSYELSGGKRHSILGRARIPILAKHSYIDTEARKLSEGLYGNNKYRIVLLGIVGCFILSVFSFAATLRAIIFINMVDDGSSLVSTTAANYMRLSSLSLIYVVGNVAMLVTLKDLFHVNVECNFAGSDYIRWMIRPFIAFIYALLGVENKNKCFHDLGQNLETEHILSSVEEMIHSSTNSIRDEVQKRTKELKEDILSNDKSSSIVNDI